MNCGIIYQYKQMIGVRVVKVNFNCDMEASVRRCVPMKSSLQKHTLQDTKMAENNTSSDI